MNEVRNERNELNAPTGSAWWVAGTVTIKGITYEARKHRIFRFVQGLSWGSWQDFCDPHKARKLFQPNNEIGQSDEPK